MASSFSATLAKGETDITAEAQPADFAAIEFLKPSSPSTEDVPRTLGSVSIGSLSTETSEPESHTPQPTVREFMVPRVAIDRQLVRMGLMTPQQYDNKYNPIFRRNTFLGAISIDNTQDWLPRALCRETDPEAFFVELGESTKDAKKVCQGCEVRDACLQYALDHDERFGVWGGLSERERRKLKKQAG